MWTPVDDPAENVRANSERPENMVGRTGSLQSYGVRFDVYQQWKRTDGSWKWVLKSGFFLLFIRLNVQLLSKDLLKLLLTNREDESYLWIGATNQEDSETWVWSRDNRTVRNSRQNRHI